MSGPPHRRTMNRLRRRRWRLDRDPRFAMSSTIVGERVMLTPTVEERVAWNRYRKMCRPLQRKRLDDAQHVALALRDAKRAVGADVAWLRKTFARLLAVLFAAMDAIGSQPLLALAAFVDFEGKTPPENPVSALVAAPGAPSI